MIRKLFNLILLSAVCACCFSCSNVSAMEITEQELTSLENNLIVLESNNQKSQAELKTLKNELMQAQNQLQILNYQSRNQEQLLLTVNESLEKYEQEMQRKQNRLKMQRNFAYALVFLMLYESK